MQHCLSKSQLLQLLNLIWEADRENTSAMDIQKLADDHLRGLIQESMDWQLEISGLAYLLARILDGEYFDNKIKEHILRLFYRLPESMFFTIQGFDTKYLSYMISRGYELKSLGLELGLGNVQEDLGNFRYD